MFLAILYLICWDYDKFKTILPFAKVGEKPFRFKKSLPLIILGAVGGILAFSFFMIVNQSFAKLGFFGLIAGSTGGRILGLLNSWQIQKNLIQIHKSTVVQ